MRNTVKRWQFHGLLQPVIISLMFLAVTVPPVAAQQVTGEPGSPSATTTIDGKQLPPRPPKFGGLIKEDAKNSKPWWPPRIAGRVSSAP